MDRHLEAEGCQNQREVVKIFCRVEGGNGGQYDTKSGECHNNVGCIFSQHGDYNNGKCHFGVAIRKGQNVASLSPKGLDHQKCALGCRYYNYGYC